MEKKVYAEIANVVNALKKSREGDAPQEIINMHKKKKKRLENDFLPSGSGFDKGSYICTEMSSRNKLVIETSYHHMNHGQYVGWSDLQIIVRPDLITGVWLDVEVKRQDSLVKEMTGEPQTDVQPPEMLRDYVGQHFNGALTQTYEPCDANA